LNHFNLFLFMF